MMYFLCEFEYGYQGTFYQQSNVDGSVRFFDMNGVELFLEAPYGYRIIDENPPKQPWMT